MPGRRQSVAGLTGGEPSASETLRGLFLGRAVVGRDLVADQRGLGGQRIEQLLLAAKKPGDVNEAIDLGVRHFLKKPDHRIPKRGHRRFAQQLDQRRMRPAT